MLDPKLLRSDLPGVAAALARRGFVLDVGAFAALEEQRKSVQIEADRLRAERNANAKAVGYAKSKGEDAARCWRPGKPWERGCKGSKSGSKLIQAQVADLQLGLPNILHASVPEGLDESANVEVRRCGMPREFAFYTQGSCRAGRALGDGFRGGRAHFRRALRSAERHAGETAPRAGAIHAGPAHPRIMATAKHYVPYLVHAEALLGTGQLPKFEQDQFAVRGDPGFYLIPTAEVPLTNLVRDQILAPERLPLKFVAHTPCFRSEAGAVGEGHARHDSPAPVRQSRNGADRASRRFLCSARRD